MEELDGVNSRDIHGTTVRHPDNENQSDGRTKTSDSNFFRSSQSKVQYKTMKSQMKQAGCVFLIVFLFSNCSRFSPYEIQKGTDDQLVLFQPYKELYMIIVIVN